MALNALITDAQDLTWTNINLWLSLSSWMHIGRWDTLGIVLHGIQIAASHAYAFILRNNMCMSIYIYIVPCHIISFRIVSYHIILHLLILYHIWYQITYHIMWCYVISHYTDTVLLHMKINYIYKEKNIRLWMLCYIVLCYIILHNIILHYIALYCIILHYIALYCIILHYCINIIQLYIPLYYIHYVMSC